LTIPQRDNARRKGVRERTNVARCCHPPFQVPLFDEHDVPIELDLLEQRSFEQGVTMHRYAIHDVREASSC
jgi:hypothetical protein